MKRNNPEDYDRMNDPDFFETPTDSDLEYFAVEDDFPDRLFTGDAGQALKKYLALLKSKILITLGQKRKLRGEVQFYQESHEKP